MKKYENKNRAGVGDQIADMPPITYNRDIMERIDDLFEVANSELRSFQSIHNRDVRFETE